VDAKKAKSFICNCIYDEVAETLCKDAIICIFAADANAEDACILHLFYLLFKRHFFQINFMNV
jgi:hypothetical protein